MSKNIEYRHINLIELIDKLKMAYSRVFDRWKLGAVYHLDAQVASLCGQA